MILGLFLLLLGLASAAYDDVFKQASVPQFHHGSFQDMSDSIRYDVHGFLHSRAQLPFEVPLELNIGLVGFDGDGGYRYTLDAHYFNHVLNQTIARHRPACMETKQRLDVEHKLYFNVLPVGRLAVLAMEQAIRETMTEAGTTRQTEFGKEVPLYEVEATKLEPLFDQLYRYMFGAEADASSSLNTPMPVAIFLLNFDKARMNPAKNRTGEHPDIKELTGEEILSQESDYVYRYRYNGGPSSQVWLSSRRYMVIDIAAGPCTYGKIDSDEGSVGYRSVPRLQNLFSPGRTSLGKATHDIFSGQLAALVASAVEHVISPDVRYEIVDPTQRLLVPIIVLRNHIQYSLLHSGAEDAIDLKAIEKEVKKMVQPGQEVVVVGGTHNLHDHEKLAIALRKALRSLSTHETSKDGRYRALIKPYLDAAILREEFRLSADVLASGLLEVADPSLANTFFHYMDWPQEENRARDPVLKSSSREGLSYAFKEDKEKRRAESRLRKPVGVEKAYGTRVVPVFVLSLAGMNEELLLQGDSPVWTSSDAVFVLQHASEPFNLSYVFETSRVKAVPASPQRHIIAGLAAVVGGLVAPFERMSSLLDRPQINWLWAFGHHPFGPFSNTSGISQLMIDTALRNSVYARVDKALRAIRDCTESIQAFTGEYLKTPLGEALKGKKQSVAELWLDRLYKKWTNLPKPIPQELVDQLENYLDDLEKQLVEISSLLFDHRLEEAYHNSTNILYYTTFAKAYVDHVLETERERMRCCNIVHHSPPLHYSQVTVYAAILAAGFLIYFVVIAFASLTGDYKS